MTQPTHTTLRTKGTLEYDPRLRPENPPDPWWLIVRACEDTRRYYAHWVEVEYDITLQTPAWGSHISVIRGERPPPRRRRSWGQFQGEQVSFTCSLDGLMCHRGIWWLPVRCPRLETVRSQLGLDQAPNPALHWTLGRER